MAFISHPFIKPETVESKLYQEVLAARILEKGSTLLVAPTALGKTVVAVLVSAEVLKAGKKVLFMAPTKPLAVQHERSMKKFLNIADEDMIVLTGTIAPEKRRKAFEQAKIISATPQTIQNDLVSGEITLKDFGLVVFDESHRAIGDYSYVFIAEQYVRHCENPLILALTASPGGEEEKIQSVCRNLFIKNVEIKTHDDEDVKGYVNQIKVEWVKVDLPPKFLEAKVLLDRFQKEQIEIIKKMGFGIGKKYFSRKDMLMLQGQIRRDIVSHGKTQPSLYLAASRIAALLKVSHALTLLETQGTDSLHEYMEKMASDSALSGSSKAVKTVMADSNIMKARALSEQLVKEKQVHPKLEALKHILVDQFHKKPESKVIVFNHYRNNIRAIERYLAPIESIKAARFIGQATKGEDRGLTQKEQVQILIDLKEGKYNTLLASSVAEEGLDIPEVDLVVLYEPVPSEIRSIQRRGRTGRKSEGKVIILLAKDTRDEAFYYSGMAKERKMKATLRDMQKPQLIPQKKLDQQMTLMKYTPGYADKVIIYVDTREQASGVITKLKNYDAVIQVKQLEVGDYILSDDVVVERKTVDDFLSSVFDGRLFNQLSSMAQNYSAPLIILEGDPRELYTTRNIHENAIRGVLASIALNYRVPILYSADDDETAKLVYQIAKREQTGKDNEIRLRVGRKGLTTEQQQQYVLEGFPLVGPQLAHALLRKFGSIRTIVNASIKELQEVEKMGPIKAAKIHEVLNEYYKGEE
ncbi:MAG TPA: DEAD/DEAH box helicase [archaeon]|nr:DEAD/DEAH box helicase [archaeon]